MMYGMQGMSSDAPEVRCCWSLSCWAAARNHLVCKAWAICCTVCRA
jgi:hypothetical protein